MDESQFTVQAVSFENQANIMTSASANPSSSPENLDENWQIDCDDEWITELDNHGTLHDDTVASAGDLGENSAGVTNDDPLTFFVREFGSWPNACDGPPLASNSHDEALGQNPPGEGEGEESPPTLTQSAQADLRRADEVNLSSDDSPLLHVQGLGSDPKSDREGGVPGVATHHNNKERPPVGDIQEESLETLDSSIAQTDMGDNRDLRQSNEEELCTEQRLQRNRGKDWTPAEKTHFFNALRMVTAFGIFRGKGLWNAMSKCLRVIHKIERPAEACNNLWDTSLRHHNAVAKHGSTFWEMDEGERSKIKRELKVPMVFEKAWFDTISYFCQEKQSDENKGIVVYKSLVVVDKDGDKDLMGTKESKLDILKVCDDTVRPAVMEAVMELSNLSSNKHFKEVLKRTVPQVVDEVKSQVLRVIEDQNLAVGQDYGNPVFDYQFKKLVKKEVEAALERSGITPLVLDEAQKEQELQRLRELNRDLEKQKSDAQPSAQHQGRSRGRKRLKLRTKD